MGWGTESKTSPEEIKTKNHKIKTAKRNLQILPKSKENTPEKTRLHPTPEIIRGVKVNLWADGAPPFSFMPILISFFIFFWPFDVLLPGNLEKLHIFWLLFSWSLRPNFVILFAL